MTNAHEFMVGLVAGHFGVPVFSDGDRVEVLVGGINQPASWRRGTITGRSTKSASRYHVRTDDGVTVFGCHADSLRAIS